MAENAAAPPGSATMRRPRHSCACAFAIASSETSTVCRAYFWTIGNTRSPTRRGASESAARPPASASTGCPASSALVSVGDANGSTPTTLTRPAYQAAIPAISPPPPTETSTVSISGACCSSSRPSRPLAQDGFVLVERRYRHGAGLLRPCLAGRERIRVAVALDREVGAVFADALNLRRRGDARNENLRAFAELHRGIGCRRAVIAAGCRDDAGFRHFAGQHIGERAARLERARVLEQLELERERSGGQTKLVAIDLDDGRTPDMGPDDPFASRDRLRIYGVIGRVPLRALHGCGN